LTSAIHSRRTARRLNILRAKGLSRHPLRALNDEAP
jgi:hypothetical protein